MEINNLTPEEVQHAVCFINKMLSMAGGLAAMTSPEWDDKLVAECKNLVDIVGPYVSEPWFSDAVNMFIGFFHKKPTPEDAAKFIAACKAAQN